MVLLREISEIVFGKRALIRNSLVNEPIYEGRNDKIARVSSALSKILLEFDDGTLISIQTDPVHVDELVPLLVKWEKKGD